MFAKEAGRCARPLPFFRSRASSRARSPWGVLLSVVVVLLGPGTARGHEGGGHIVVPGDHFQPGATISITGSELAGTSEVVIRLESGPTSVVLGRAIVAADATLSTTAVIPQAFPLGYAKVTVGDDAGNVWSTVLLIGDRAEGPGESSAQASIEDRWLWLLVFGVGLLLFLVAGASAIRGRGSSPGG